MQQNKSKEVLNTIKTITYTALKAWSLTDGLMSNVQHLRKVIGIDL